MGEGEQVRALFHSFGAVERGERVNPVVNFRETVVVEYVFAAGLDVVQVALGDEVAVFVVDVGCLREELLACEVFVHDGAKAEIIDRVGDVFAGLGEFWRAVAGSRKTAAFGDRLAHLCLGVTKVANQDFMVVLVCWILAQEQILGLEVLMDNLVIMELADGVREVGHLRHALDNFVFGELWLDDSVERAALDEFQLEVRMAPRDSTAKRLHDAFDVRGADEVVDADLVLERAQEHVQTVQAILAGMRPVLANLDDDFFFVVALFVAWVLQPELGSVKLVGAFERKRFDKLDAFGVAVVLEIWIMVEPPLVFFHGVMRTERQVARNSVHCFSQVVPKHGPNVEK